MKFMSIVGLIAVGLAIVGAFVTIPSLGAVLVILGLIAGFVIEGPDHVRVIVSALALTALAGVLDAIPSVGAYLLSHPNIQVPKQGKYYSVNEAYRDGFPPGYNEFLDRLRHGGLGQRYASRYIGSMVADLHRTLLKGGIFLYPPTTDHPKGKLRLLYEANPIAYLVEQAGGVATDGRRRVLDLQPEAIHQRTPLIVGGAVEMAEFQRFVPHEI